MKNLVTRRGAVLQAMLLSEKVFPNLRPFVATKVLADAGTVIEIRFVAFKPIH